MQRRPVPALRPVAEPHAGLGSILLAGRTRADVAGEILRRVRHSIAPAQLWLLDARRLRRPALGGLQERADVALAKNDDPAGWPDPIRIGGPQTSTALAALDARVPGPAIARSLRVESGAGAHGLLVAPYTGRRPPVTLDRTLAQLACAAGATLENLEALRSAGKRAQQLTKLYETAHDLSAELDLDRVLDAICAKARALTGAEIAYIMLLDHARGDGFVRATDGIRTEAFKSVRLGIGLGLGGLVAEEGRPYYSSDYIHDSRFVHVVDGVVANEGIVSVMGVPLKAGDTVIGVLFAAYRRMTTFSEADVAFLESLAEHAAVALTNARLHEQTRDALERERRLHRIAEQQRQALEEINTLHERLTEIVLAEPPVDRLLRDVASALGHPVVLRDDPSDDAVCVRVAAGATTLGWLCVEDLPSSLDQQDHLGLEQAARVVALHLLRDRAVVQAQFQLRGEFLDKLLASDREGLEELIRRGAFLNLDLSKPLAVLFLLREERPAAEARASLGRSLLDLPGCLVTGRFGGVVILAPGHEPRPFAQMLAERLTGRPVRFTVGFAQAAVDIANVGDALSEARRTVRAAVALGRAGEVVCREDLGVYGALLVDEGAELRSFADRLLGPLVEYDARHGSNLLETLAVYLDAGGNATEAARRLILHVNSLYYRLNRLRELGGYDLDDPDVRFELQLALRVRRATGDGGRASPR